MAYPIDLMTKHEAFELARAVETLRQLGERAYKLNPESSHAAMNIGRLAEAAEIAADAVFNVLNTGAHMTNQPAAKEALGRR